MNGIYTTNFTFAMQLLDKGVKPEHFDGEVWYFPADGDIVALFKNYLAENESGGAVG